MTLLDVSLYNWGTLQNICFRSQKSEVTVEETMWINACHHLNSARKFGDQTLPNFRIRFTTEKDGVGMAGHKPHWWRLVCQVQGSICAFVCLSCQSKLCKRSLEQNMCHCMCGKATVLLSICTQKLWVTSTSFTLLILCTITWTYCTPCERKMCACNVWCLKSSHLWDWYLYPIYTDTASLFQKVVCQQFLLLH